MPDKKILDMSSLSVRIDLFLLKNEIITALQSISMDTEEIVFVFEEEKATQLAALFLKLCEEEIHFLRLLALMYTADRESLKEQDQPITGDACFLTEYGIFLGQVFVLLMNSEDGDDCSYWARHIEKRKGQAKVSLLKDPGRGELSKVEVDIVEFICDHFRFPKMDRDFPEWQNPEVEYGLIMKPLNNYDLLQNHLGKTKEDLDHIKENCLLDWQWKKIGET